MLYLDMDGVLVDFDKGVEEQGHHKDKEQSEELYYTNLFNRKGFFGSLKPFKDTLALWDYCKPYNPIILTARPGRKSLEEEQFIVDEKRRWVDKYLGFIDDSQFICCLRSEKLNYVGHTPHKIQILVDDMEKNCEEWNKAGGWAILHKNAQDTIKKIEYALDEAYIN